MAAAVVRQRAPAEIECGRAQWVPDGDRPACELCRVDFSLLTRRRHHCRRCGEVFCAACSSYSAPLRSNTAAGSVRMQRVCRSCASECGARSVSPRDGGHRRSADLLRRSAKELFRGSARVPAPLILGWAGRRTLAEPEPEPEPEPQPGRVILHPGEETSEDELEFHEAEQSFPQSFPRRPSDGGEADIEEEGDREEYFECEALPLPPENAGLLPGPGADQVWGPRTAPPPKVRGANYLQDGVKVESAAPRMEFCACQLFELPEGTEHRRAAPLVRPSTFFTLSLCRCDPRKPKVFDEMFLRNQELRRRGQLAPPSGTRALFSVQFLNPSGGTDPEGRPFPRHAFIFSFASAVPFGRGSPGAGGKEQGQNSPDGQQPQPDQRHDDDDGGNGGGDDDEGEGGGLSPDGALVRGLWESADPEDALSRLKVVPECPQGPAALRCETLCRLC